MDSPAVQVLPNVFDKDRLLRVESAKLSSLRQLTFREFWRDVELVQKAPKVTEEEVFAALDVQSRYLSYYGILLLHHTVIQSAKEAEQKLNPTSSGVTGNENKNDDDEQEPYALLLMFKCSI